MSIRKLPNGRWEARERTGGRDSPRPTRTFDRKADADKWVERMRRQRQIGAPPQEDVTLAEFMEVYWELHALPNLAAATRESYKLVWAKHIIGRLGSRNLRELTPRVLTRFRADLERAGVGTATVRKAMAIVQSILSFAVVEERVEFNAAAAVRKPRYERKREPYIFPPAEVEQIRARLSPLGAALVSLLAYGGPRPEEALRLRWREVGTEAIQFDGNKTHRPRWTPLLAALASDLREWRLASGRPGPSAPVIPAHDGEAWQADDWRNWRRRVWRQVAPVGSRPRDLRSSYITTQIYAGRPLTEIARYAGTSVAMIDRHYAGVIANWDGNPVPADTQIQLARQAGGRSVDVSRPGSGRSEP
jgi:integrase